MKTVTFYKRNRSDNLLHIETELCVINIRIGLSDIENNPVTSIEIIPDHKGITIDGNTHNRVIEVMPEYKKGG